MKSRRGFTLIELLAVILILGVIALIAVPVVNRLVTQARTEANQSTSANILKTIESECQVAKLQGESVSGLYSIENIKDSVKGSVNGEGTYEVDDDCNVSFAVKYDNTKSYCYSKTFSEDFVSYYELEDDMTCLPTETKATDLSCFDYEEENNEITITGYKCGGSITEMSTDSIIGMSIKSYSEGTNMDVVIPNRINGKPVTKIGLGAFAPGVMKSETDFEIDYNKKVIVNSVVIPDNVKEVESFAFSMNKINYLILSNNIEKIGDTSFAYNDLSGNLTLPINLTSLGGAAFSMNQFTSLTINEKLESIGQYAFGVNKLTGTVIIPDNVKSVGMLAFTVNDINKFVIGKNANVERGVIYSWQNENIVSNPNLREVVNKTGKELDWAYVISAWEAGVSTNATFETGNYVIYPLSGGTYTVKITK